MSRARSALLAAEPGKPRSGVRVVKLLPRHQRVGRVRELVDPVRPRGIRCRPRGAPPPSTPGRPRCHPSSLGSIEKSQWTVPPSSGPAGPARTGRSISSASLTDILHVQPAYVLLGPSLVDGITTTALNDVDPQAWLANVLSRIADTPQSRLHELLPWNWVPVQHREPAE